MTVKCANCPSEAVYSYRVNDSILIQYCEKDLPQFLWEAGRAGLLPLQFPAPVEEKPVKKKAKEEKAVVEESVEEVAEEATDADN